MAKSSSSVEMKNKLVAYFIVCVLVLQMAQLQVNADADCFLACLTRCRKGSLPHLCDFTCSNECHIFVHDGTFIYIDF